MDTSTLRQGELIAGAGGLALFIFLFLPWYGVDAQIAGFSASESASGWETLSVIDIILFLVATFAVAVAVARAADAIPDDAPVGTAVASLGGLAVILILYRIIDLPTPDVPAVAQGSIDFSRKIGVFLALIAAAAIAYGGYRSMGEEGPGRPTATA